MHGCALTMHEKCIDSCDAIAPALHVLSHNLTTPPTTSFNHPRANKYLGFWTSGSINLAFPNLFVNSSAIVVHLLAGFCQRSSSTTHEQHGRRYTALRPGSAEPRSRISADKLVPANYDRCCPHLRSPGFDYVRPAHV